MDHVVIFGVAGGSAINALVRNLGYDNKITGVEIDSEIIELSNEFLELDKIKYLKIVIANAFEFVLKTKIKYNLILTDVVHESDVPNFLFQKIFYASNC